MFPGAVRRRKLIGALASWAVVGVALWQGAPDWVLVPRRPMPAWYQPR